MTSEQRILRNAVRCKRCNEVIESIHRHDWVRCGCGGTFVDGGLDYVRYGWSSNEGVGEPEALTEYAPRDLVLAA